MVDNRPAVAKAMAGYVRPDISSSKAECRKSNQGAVMHPDYQKKGDVMNSVLTKTLSCENFFIAFDTFQY